jgi:sensor histidine kinase regulating citrate/malate metabolism
MQRSRRSGTAGACRLPWEPRRWLVTYRDLLITSGAPGLVVVDGRGRVRLWSEGVTRLLGRLVPPGTRAASVVVDCAHGPVALDDLDGPVLVEGRELRAVRRPVSRGGSPPGWALELHDETERLRLTARLAAERDSTVALRARAHEADNRLHTVVSLVELGHVRQAVDFATAVLAHGQELHESIHSTVDDPMLAALLLGKATCADEAGVALHLDGATDVPSAGLPSEELVLLLGNLIDNAIDAAAATPPPRWVHVLARTSPDRVRLEVSDSGPGLPPEQVAQAFTPGWTTKPHREPGDAHGQGLGLALVASTVRRLRGTVSVERWVGARFVVELPLPVTGEEESR